MLGLSPSLENHAPRRIENARDDQLAFRGNRGGITCCGHFFLLNLLFHWAILNFAQIVFQAIETLFPEAAIALDPIGCLLERTCFEPARTPLRLASARDQTGAFEHLKMLRDGGKGHLEWLGQLRDRDLAGGKAGKYRAASRIGQGGEGGVEVRRHWA